jgi:AraC-like DNA-binding protein
MDNIYFYNSFGFREYRCTHKRFTDNSGGISCHFLAYVRNGTYTITTEFETVKVKAGELLYIPIGLCYRSEWEADTVLESYGFSYIPLPENTKFALQKLPLSAETDALLAKLSENKHISCYSVGIFYQLLDKLLPYLIKKSADPHTELIEKAKEYVYAHLDFKVADLAKYCGISESGLFALFKKTLSISPVELKNRIKAQKAAEYLETTDMSIEEISERLGFSSPSYFRRILKAQYGMSPREIRSRAVMHGTVSVTCGADSIITCCGCDSITYGGK